MTEKIKIYSALDLPPQVETAFKKPSLTKQEFAEDCDINNIIKSYDRTGVLSSGLLTGRAPRSPSFGDFSNVVDFQTAKNMIIDAEQRFNDLPSRVRNRFENDPAQLIEFLENPKNREEAIKLGLIDAPAVATPSAVAPKEQAGQGVSGETTPPK